MDNHQNPSEPVNLQKGNPQKETEVQKLRISIKNLKDENQKLADKNQYLSQSLQKTKKMKNMEIDSLNKIIKNLKKQIQKLEKNQGVDEFDKYSLKENNHSEEKQSSLNDKRLTRFETRIEQENKQGFRRIHPDSLKDQRKNYSYEDQKQIREMIHQIRLELADMKHSQLKLNQQNEKIHQVLRSLSNQDYSQEREYNAPTYKKSSISSLHSLNMGECFMGRKSKIQNIPDTEKSWGRIEQLQWNPHSMGENMNRNQNYLVNNLIRPQSQISFRKGKFESWGEGLQQKLNYIKEQNQQLKRSIFQ